MLKRRWRKLLLLDHLDIELEVYITVAPCVLYNFCLLHDDFDDMYLYDGPYDGDDHDGHYHPADGRAETKRTHLMRTEIDTQNSVTKHKFNSIETSI